MSKQSMRVVEVHHTLRPVVPPITLPQKFISILDSSANLQGQQQNSTTVLHETSAQSVPQTSMPIDASPSGENTVLVTSTARTTNLLEASTMQSLFAAVDGNNLKEADPNNDRRPQSQGDTKSLLEAVSVALKSDLVSQHKQAQQKANQPSSCEPGTLDRKHLTEKSRTEQRKQIETNSFSGEGYVSDTTQKRDVMQFFQEQEQSLHEQFLHLPQSAADKSTRPQVFKPQQLAGLEHLENLIRLMEKLTSLKDENSKLRKRCDYLESTRTLLQAKQDLKCEKSKSPLSFITPPSHRKQRHHQHRHDKVKLPTNEDPYRLCHNVQSRMRISNSEELERLALAESSSDHESQTLKHSMHKRSYSAGSLDFVDVKAGSRNKGQTRTGNSKPKMKNSKWTRVKKVITGQKFYEDLGTTFRTFRDRGRSSHGDYTINSPRGLRHVSSRISDIPSGSARDIDGVKAPSTIVSFHKTASTVCRGQDDDDPDLTSEIWMGPPDWWEEYESRKETEGPTTNNATSTIIEVTTMYLGSNRDTTVSTIEVPVTMASSIKPHEKSMKTDDSPRQGVANLNLKETIETDNSNDLFVSVDNKKLHKSPSCKSTDFEIPQISDQSNQPEMRQEKKPQRSAWGRVKDIIHTRKDSIRRRLKRDKCGLENEEMSETDVQVCVDDQTRPDLLSESVFNRRTAKLSPTAVRQHKTNDSTLEEAVLVHKSSSTNIGCNRGNVDMAAILGGNISEEFTKKMLEWERLKSKKQLCPAQDESDLGSLDLSKMPREFPVRTIDLRDFKGNVPDNSSDVVTTEESNTSMEVLGAPSISVDDTPRHRTGGFHSKMQEWEKFKESSNVSRDFTSVMEVKENRGVKAEIRKNKRSREGKDREKMKRQTERAMRKMDKGEGSSEKGKTRVIKEPGRTLECEEMVKTTNGEINEIVSEETSQNVQSSSVKDQEQVSKSIEGGDNACESEKLRRNSAEGISPAETNSEASIEEMGDESSSTTTQHCLTTSNIATLERANSQLLENLHKKEIDYAAVREEVQKVNEKLVKVREDHAAEMVRFQNDITSGKFAGPVKLEVGELEVTVGVLEEKIKMMENLGEKLASSMESAAVGKWQSIEAEETIHNQLVELIEQMRTMLVEASQTEEHSQKVIALSNFETFYAQAMKLQVQMNNLRLSHLERNREIMVIKRQLLLQEVNNLLLQADITRRETELYQFQEAKLFPSFKRWHTFGGADKQKPQVQVELPPPAVAPAYSKTGPQKEVRSRQGEAPRINIPYLSEEMNLASIASSSIPAPAPPTAIDSTCEFLAVQSMSVLDQLHSNLETTHEKMSNDYDPLMVEPHRHVNPLLGTYLAQQQSENARTFDGYQEKGTSQKCPHFSSRVQPRTNPPDQPIMVPVVKSKTLRESLKSSFKKKRSTKSTKEATDCLDKSLSPSADPTSKTSVGGKSVPRTAHTKPELTTFCDSVPLHKEIAELRRVKRQVEKEASAVNRTEDREYFLWNLPKMESRIREVGEETISRQTRHWENKLQESARITNCRSKTPPTREGSEHVQIAGQIGETISSDLKDINMKTLISDRSGLQLQSISGHVSSDYKAAVGQSHVSSAQQRPLEEDIQFKKYCTNSSRKSPTNAEGKPPLPRYTSPSRNCISASPLIKRGIRSKSVGDIDPESTRAITSKTLQEVISKFDECATVHDSDNGMFKLRKTPSPTLYLPRVGIVSRVRRVKPAAELLEESQRYRSGSSIYTTRILQRYFPKDGHRSDSIKNIQNNEDLSGKSNMPLQDTARKRSAGSSRTGSDISLNRNDALLTQTIDHTINTVRRCSSSGGLESKNSSTSLSNSADAKQMNELSQTRKGQHHCDFPDNISAYEDNDTQRIIPSTSKVTTQNCKPGESTLLGSSSKYELSHQTSSSLWLPSDNFATQKLDSQTKQTSHKSLPSLMSPDVNEKITSYEEGKKESKVLNYSETDTRKHQTKNNNTKPLPVSTPSSPIARKNVEMCVSNRKSEKIPQGKTTAGKLSSSCFNNRRNSNRPDTIAILCEQSIFFDLGMFRCPQQPGIGDTQFMLDSRQTRSWDPAIRNRSEAAAVADTRSSWRGVPTTLSPTSARKQSPSTVNVTDDNRQISSSSEGEITHSPTSPKKKKSKQFIHSNCLQKSRKFFKISK